MIMYNTIFLFVLIIVAKLKMFNNINTILEDVVYTVISLLAFDKYHMISK